MNSYIYYLVLENKKDADSIILFLARSENMGIDVIKSITNGNVSTFPFVNRNVITCIVNSSDDIASTNNRLMDYCYNNNIYYQLMVMHNGNYTLSSNNFKPKNKINCPSYLKIIK